MTANEIARAAAEEILRPRDWVDESEQIVSIIVRHIEPLAKQAKIGRRAVELLQRMLPWISGEDVPPLMDGWTALTVDARAAGMMEEPK